MPGEKSEAREEPKELFTEDMFSGELHPVGGKKQLEAPSELDDWSSESPKPAKPRQFRREPATFTSRTAEAMEKVEEESKKRVEELQKLGLHPRRRKNT